MKSPFVPVRMQRQITAFSLVEVTIAIGLVAFSLVAIIGMLPVGLRSELDSSQVLRASQALNLIASDIRSVARPYTEKATAQSGPAMATPPATHSPRFNIPFTADSSGDFYLDDQLNVTTATSTGNAVPQYVVHYRCDKGPGLAPYKFKILIAWPGVAKFQGGGSEVRLKNSQGLVEIVVTVSRL